MTDRSRIAQENFRRSTLERFHQMANTLQHLELRVGLMEKKLELRLAETQARSGVEDPQ